MSSLFNPLCHRYRWQRCDGQWISGKGSFVYVIAFRKENDSTSTGVGASNRLCCLYVIRLLRLRTSQTSIFWKGIATRRFQGYQGLFTLPLAYQGVSKYAWQTIGKSTVSWGFLRDTGIPRKCYIPRYGSDRCVSIQPCLDQGPLRPLHRGSWRPCLDDF
jgi:hypothetical protein